MQLQLLTESFESHSLTVLKDDAGQAWFLSKDLAEPLGVNRNAIRMQVADLAPSDIRVIPIDTNKGSRKASFVSESGALQIIVQSRKPEAARLRKWVCDIAVKYSKGELVSHPAPAPAADYITKADLLDLTKSLTEGFSSLLAALANPGRQSRKVRLFDLPALTRCRRTELAKLRFYTAAEFLSLTTNQAKHIAGEASGLAQRCQHYIEEFIPQTKNDSAAFFRYQDAGKPVVYFDVTILRVVYESGWRKGQDKPNINGLFPRRTDLKSLPGGKAEGEAV